MFFIIKFTIYFSLSFLILSVPVGGKYLFDHVNSIAKPYTSKVFGTVEGALDKGLDETKRIGKDLFNNTSPSTDKVFSRSASTKKPTSSKKSLPKDSYTPEEKRALLRVLGH